MKFKVKEFRTENEYYESSHEDLGSEFCETMVVKDVPEDEKDHMCRFCWTNTDSEDNPKVQACKCTGSVKYVHFFCLQKWLETKMQTKQTDNHHTLSWKQFQCEICMQHLAYSFWYKERIWNLVNFPRPEDEATPYIILESMDLEKNSSRIIHTVMASDSKSKFSLGRGHESDLRINDISVSRLHAHLEYKEGEGWILVDCRSKFGTLALFQQPLPLELD